MGEYRRYLCDVVDTAGGCNNVLRVEQAVHVQVAVVLETSVDTFFSRNQKPYFDISFLPGSDVLTNTTITADLV